jgi:hypothetical protein
MVMMALSRCDWKGIYLNFQLDTTIKVEAVTTGNLPPLTFRHPTRILPIDAVTGSCLRTIQASRPHAANSQGKQEALGLKGTLKSRLS